MKLLPTKLYCDTTSYLYVEKINMLSGGLRGKGLKNDFKRNCSNFFIYPLTEVLGLIRPPFISPPCPLFSRENPGNLMKFASMKSLKTYPLNTNLKNCY